MVYSLPFSLKSNRVTYEHRLSTQLLILILISSKTISLKEVYCLLIPLKFDTQWNINFFFFANVEMHVTQRN